MARPDLILSSCQQWRAERYGKIVENDELVPPREEHNSGWMQQDGIEQENL